MDWLRRWRLEAVALAAGALHLRFIGWPMTPDEAGFLMVARQWGPGSSLYGDYWVDRPPGLIALYQAAWHLAGPAGITLLAAAATAFAVWAIGRVAMLAQPDASPLPAMLVVAAMMNSRLFAASETNGELLATPFVVGAVACMLRVRARRDRQWAWAFAAGTLAMGAAMIKQNFIDAVIVAAVLLVFDPAFRGRRVLLLGAGVAGGAATLASLAALSVARGTALRELPYAVIGFRLDALAAVNDQALYGPSGRPLNLALMVAASGVWLVVLLAVRLAARPTPTRPLLVACLAMLGWEGVGLIAGGGYWTHYAMGLTAGIGCLLAVSGPPRGQRVVAAVALASMALTPLFLLRAPWQPARTELQDARIGQEIARQTRSGDTMVVVVGSPQILYASGLESPYPYLWKPIHTLRDPELAELSELVVGPDAPDWLLIDVDARPMLDDDVLTSRYEPVREIRGWMLWRAR